MSVNVSDYISQKIKRIPVSGIGKFFDLANERPDIVSLSIGEPDFVTPQAIRQAAICSLNEGKTAYSSSPGLLELRRAVSSYLKRNFALDYNPQGEILITVGGSEAVDLALWAFLDEGDEIIIPEPAFVSYLPCALMSGCKAVPVTCRAENGFKPAIADLQAAVTPKTKMLILNYPNNPTGATFSGKELSELAEFACRNNLLVISDEIYADLCYANGGHISIASLPKMFERTIVVSGASKAFAMTGWRLGYVAASKDLLAPMLKIHQSIVMCAPTVSQYAAIEAFNNCYDEVMQMREQYHLRRDLIVRRLRAAGLDVVEPQGAFYVFPAITKSGLKSEEFCLNLLNYDVAVIPGKAFGGEGDDHIRCSYAASAEKINIACDRIDKFMQSLK
ncbi:MAG: aminotransferase class I/II-fold pyridoxal phosphate-dependent enzyme [Clostridia bacterium]|nr:aminotransferase class I/II-fold pyridoxal phosphate-dependent enzyme [Clostridia bacterium]